MIKLKLFDGRARLDLGAESLDTRVRLDFGLEAEFFDGQALFFGPPINLTEGFGTSKLLDDILNPRRRTHQFRVLE